MATEIWGKGREQLSARASLTPEQQEVYGEAIEGFDETLASAGEDGEDPGEVAETIEKAPTANSPDDRYLVGRGARDGHAAPAAAAVRGVRPRQEARRELTSRARWCSASVISARVAGESLELRRVMNANAS